MQKGKFNVVTDGQWGSCGKGLISATLAEHYKPDVISSTSMPNAGHTAVSRLGEKHIAKALPAAAIINRWVEDYNPVVILGPTAAFTIGQLDLEAYETRIGDKLLIHPRAGVITAEHQSAECDLETGTKHLASTMQGCGAFLAEKIMRRKSLKLARDYEELKMYIMDEYMPGYLANIMGYGATIMHEGSQGFSLCINHGSHYPQCTSRSTTAMQNAADMGVGPKDIGDIYLVIRPYPIRVGNVTNGDEIVGYSGDCYADQKEISWADVAKEAGAPVEVTNGELTTVTKRLRRVFTFSDTQLKQAVIANGATKIALNFANYIDWACYGTNHNNSTLPTKVLRFIDHIQEVAGIPVALIGTGPQNDHVHIWK